ncbi:MAG: gliding motility protein GldM [Polaribacter sp.]|nr:gliding motility protein GldM [Polaribacter sp.]
MAGGKMSPRQKMINLMYLVFIAMLAMNMSKEVLSAFGYMNEELTTSNMSTTEKNTLAYAGLATKAQDQEAKYKPLNDKALVIEKLSSEFTSYLEDLKTAMTAEVADKTAYESMDKTAFLDAYFFKGDRYSKEGEAFMNNISNYRTGVVNALGAGHQKLKLTVSRRFNTEDKPNKDGIIVKWLDAHYKGFPLVASVTNLTQIQSKIKNTENEILTSLLGGQLESEVSMTNYKGIVNLKKNAYYPGEKVVGSVVLGRYDKTLEPSKVILNGKEYDNFKDGEVVLDFSASRAVGDKNIEGTIFFMEDNKEIPVPFSNTYSVIPQPNRAIVSADRMNVVYRGIENPISVSLPGVSDTNLKATSSSGVMKGRGSKYTLMPGKADNVNVIVRATLDNGTPVKSEVPFRVKDIPAAMGTARGQFGIVRMPKNSVARVKVGAGLPDFVFDLKLNVSSFKVKVPNQLTVVVKGTKFNAQAKKVLAKARRGDVITIFDIEATIAGNSSYKLKKVLPVNIEITN